MTRLEFNKHVHQLSRKLYLVAFRFLRRQDEAEDAVQEVFIRLWGRRGELDSCLNLEAFATTSVKNYCIDHLRRRKILTTEDNSSYGEVHDDEPTPAEAMEKAETAQILDNIIQKLPELYRAIITMKEIDGLSYDEIAEITGQNVNTLRVNLSRARKIIRDEFQKHRYEYAGNTQPSR